MLRRYERTGPLPAQHFALDARWREINRLMPGVPSCHGAALHVGAGTQLGYRLAFMTLPTLVPVTVLTLLLQACAAGSARQPRTWLDERTAATVTAQEPRVVFAHENQARATNVRDYVQVGAVEVNRSGTRAYYLVLISWSTVDRSPAERATLDGELVRSTLWADDRPIELRRIAQGRAAAGVFSAPYAAPAPAAIESWYPVTLNEIGALARASTLKLTAQSGDTPRSYQLWQSDRGGFAAFLSRSTHTR